MPILKPQPLTRDAFAQYGDVIDTTDPEETRLINEGYTTRFHDLANLDLIEAGGKPCINIFRSEPLPTPLVLKMMERHPLSSQSFFPITSSPYLVVVAPAGELLAGKIEAFLAEPGQGVNYHRGTWHHYCLALNKTMDFLVVDRDGEDDNCDEIELARHDWLDIDLSALQLESR